MENNPVCLGISVIGKVQGVWFRASTKRKADELGITGMVRNKADGTVYIEAEGPPQQMNQFLQWCHEGPEFAKVTSVHTETINPKGFSDFKIQR